MKTLELYVKSTSNYQAGLPLMSFVLLSEEWVGDRLRLPFGEEGMLHTVVGWTSLYYGTACPVHVVNVQTREDQVGYLVYGGDSGVRVLDRSVKPILGVDDHLPRGYGLPIIWVDDLNDMPKAVQQIVALPPRNDASRLAAWVY